ncbi:hypothetical protein M0802_000995 [Mischocyttarus mexicanus]|nr:hypothetical protein M0802_000995 [Mischocyttarus mexicanus]
MVRLIFTEFGNRWMGGGVDTFKCDSFNDDSFDCHVGYGFSRNDHSDQFCTATTTSTGNYVSMKSCIIKYHRGVLNETIDFSVAVKVLEINAFNRNGQTFMKTPAHHLLVFTRGLIGGEILKTVKEQFPSMGQYNTNTFAQPFNWLYMFVFFIFVKARRSREKKQNNNCLTNIRHFQG